MDETYRDQCFLTLMKRFFSLSVCGIPGTSFPPVCLKFGVGFCLSNANYPFHQLGLKMSWFLDLVILSKLPWHNRRPDMFCWEINQIWNFLCTWLTTFWCMSGTYCMHIPLQCKLLTLCTFYVLFLICATNQPVLEYLNGIHLSLRSLIFDG
jgi:hypothetical protein